MPDTLIIYLIHWDNSGSFWQKRRISGRLKDLLLVKLQAVQQLSSLKRTVEEQGSFLSLSLTMNDHWLPAGAGGNSTPSISNSDLMRCFIPTISLTKVSRNWVR